VHEKIIIQPQVIGLIGGRTVRIDNGKPASSEYQENKVVLVDDVKLMDVHQASGRSQVFNYIELHNISGQIEVAGQIHKYHDSAIEDAILGFFSGLLGRADLIHVEYEQDKVTYRELQTGVPPVLSRLGFKLFNLGFTWFKDFYIAEGWLEGPVKLTAEKPLDREMVNRNLSSMKREVEGYIAKTADTGIHNRAEKVLTRISDRGEINNQYVKD
jgi:hypothetical protein